MRILGGPKKQMFFIPNSPPPVPRISSQKHVLQPQFMVLEGACENGDFCVTNPLAIGPK